MKTNLHYLNRCNVFRIGVPTEILAGNPKGLNGNWSHYLCERFHKIIYQYKANPCCLLKFDRSERMVSFITGMVAVIRANMYGVFY